jgi:glycosyltransferase involved in cell wall biosynthesis
MPHLLSVNSYHYRRGGADAVYFDHAALMESLGWRNTFFSMHHPNNVRCDSSVYFVDEIQLGHDYSLAQKLHKATKVVYSFEAQRRLRALIADRKPDIAHLHNIYHHLSPSILSVLKLAEIPVVMTAHDLKIACPNNKMLTGGAVCERCKGGRFHHAVLNRCIHGSFAASAVVAAESALHHALGSYRRHVDRIVVPSRFFLAKFEEWGWSRNQFAYIPNFVDAARFSPAYDAGDYVAYVGRLAPEKGVFTLIRAAARTGVPVVLAGTGPAEAALQSLAAELKAPVSFAGFRSGAALHTLMREARALVLPSEWYENAPISILEGFALGKPAIGARIGGIPEMIRAEETGWLFESGNVESLESALREVMACDPRKIADMGKTGRLVVENEFSRDRYLASMLAVYAELGVSAAAQLRPAPTAA